ncbi:phosphoglycerate kinase [Chromobacterium amazonense]|uniref:Phosphoglycerate kinase n=1 Tax=Chromobacterium amazonense TaxID=1382803 RepID=A0A2S9WZ94_9NEIS|nr:phosphoglycerate kinase [Chromobacterium amazonense]PRP68783.1 phosphoglycerate kinase [Chromobacterium amazonense]
MGLDMYARSVKAEVLGDQQIDFNFNQLVDRGDADFKGDLAYWRKFNHLHGWMENLYVEKGGMAVFNCEAVRLMPQDIDRLERDMAAGKLRHTPGFFFGDDAIHPEDWAALRKFIADARAEFAKGRAVLYDSWW